MSMRGSDLPAVLAPIVLLNSIGETVVGAVIVAGVIAGAIVAYRKIRSRRR